MVTLTPYRRYLRQRVCGHTPEMLVRPYISALLPCLRRPTSSTSQGVMYVKGFRGFITRGNLIDLAVAVVIGTAFTAVVTAIVKDFITPLIGAIWGGKKNFENLAFRINGSTFNYGDLINNVITFLIIAAVVYFLIVAPMAKLV